MGGWLNYYSFKCQPVDYTNDPIAMRVSLAWKRLGKRNIDTESKKKKEKNWKENLQNFNQTEEKQFQSIWADQRRNAVNN